MLISQAFAQTAEAPAGGGGALLQLLPFIAIFAIMYFLIIRPQQKRMKEHRDMVASLRRGDIVVTAGGLIGKVVKVSSDTELQVELAENVRVRVVKGTIAEVRSKTEPVREVVQDEPDEYEDDDSLIDDQADDSRDEPERKPSPPREPVRVASQPRANVAKRGKSAPVKKTAPPANDARPDGQDDDETDTKNV
jgi:preprotein translocase subunit YajC